MAAVLRAWQEPAAQRPHPGRKAAVREQVCVARGGVGHGRLEEEELQDCLPADSCLSGPFPLGSLRQRGTAFDVQRAFLLRESQT